MLALLVPSSQSQCVFNVFGSCLFQGAGRAVGPRPKLRQQAVDRTAMLVTSSPVAFLTQLTAAILPVIILVIINVPVKHNTQKKKHKKNPFYMQQMLASYSMNQAFVFHNPN